MSKYPILVEKYRPGQALDVVCQSCDAEMIGDPSENSDGLYTCAVPSCQGLTTWKYEEADKCGGCGKLGHFHERLGYCCSRRCQLQAEYAKELADRKAEREAHDA